MTSAMTAFEEYIEEYGFHFNRKLYLFAVSLMVDRKGNSVEAMDKSRVSEFLRANGVELDNAKGYDAAYVLAMAKADYWCSSINEDKRLALFVKDYIDDPDGSDTKAFDHFIVDCKANGEPIEWLDMM